MSTYLDYLEWRGDLTMNERPFNEVDNLILSELVYFHFDQLLDENGRLYLTIRELYERYQALEAPRSYWNNDPIPLLIPCAQSKRFGDVIVTDFENIVDQKQGIQFSAATFHLCDGTRYVAFRGTDSSIVGWREDCNFSFMEKTPAQSEALRYLEAAVKAHRGGIRVGGHSKGGNLAVYAAAFCTSHQRRILEVYSNDGPGFNQYIVSSPHYQKVLPKVKLIIPDASIISILLSNKQDKIIIRSSAEDGAHQHLPYTWLVQCDHFVRADSQTSSSILLNELVSKWLDSMNDEEKKLFISTVFDVMEASGVLTLEELNANRWISYNAIIKAVTEQSEEARRGVLDSVKKLAEASKDIFWDEAKKRFEPFRHRKRSQEGESPKIV